MTTGSPPPRLNARGPRNELVRFTSGNAYAEVSARYAGGGAGYDLAGMITGQRISDADKAGGCLSGKAGRDAANPAGSGVSRRRGLANFGAGVGALRAEQAMAAAEVPPGATPQAQARIQAQASIPPN